MADKLDNFSVRGIILLIDKGMGMEKMLRAKSKHQSPTVVSELSVTERTIDSFWDGDLSMIDLPLSSNGSNLSIYSVLVDTT